MTFYNKMMSTLQSCGMFESQAKSVMEQVVKNSHEFGESMKDRWHDDVDSYPPIIVNACWMAVRVVALSWIEDNIPEAWYKPMFQ